METNVHKRCIDYYKSHKFDMETNVLIFTLKEFSSLQQVANHSQGLCIQMETLAYIKKDRKCYIYV